MLRPKKITMNMYNKCILNQIISQGFQHILLFLYLRQIAIPSLIGNQTTKTQSRDSVLLVKFWSISEAVSIRFPFPRPSFGSKTPTWLCFLNYSRIHRIHLYPKTVLMYSTYCHLGRYNLKYSVLLFPTYCTNYWYRNISRGISKMF